MAILIKDMEMPTEKPIAVVIHPDGTAYCAEMFAGVCTEYLIDCVAIPVPPHGRLIDADALIAAHKDVCSRSMKFNLDLAPTVIPAEEGK